MKDNRFGNIIYLPGPNGGRYPYCNSLFIEDEVRAVIDPGSDRSLLVDLNKNSVVDIIINSHYHEDHFTYNYLFPDAQLYVHEKDAPCFSSAEKILECYGVRGSKNEIYWRDYIVNNFNYRTRPVARGLADGDIIDFGGTKLEVVHTPGHTAGHIGFYCASEGLLFTGDLDFTPFGPWYGDAVSDIDDTIKSVQRLLTYQADIFVTSHESGIIRGDIAGRAETYLGIIDRREEKILKFLSRPRKIEEIVNQWIIYDKPREPKEFYLFAENAMVNKHLNRLSKNGRIEFIDDKFFRI